VTHITTCSRCGRAYEESSEESANAPRRFCGSCRAHWATGSVDIRALRFTIDEERPVRPATVEGRPASAWQ
jgi:hypothetical protein